MVLITLLLLHIPELVPPMDMDTITTVVVLQHLWLLVPLWLALLLPDISNPTITTTLHNRPHHPPPSPQPSTTNLFTTNNSPNLNKSDTRATTNTNSSTLPTFNRLPTTHTTTALAQTSLTPVQEHQAKECNTSTRTDTSTAAHTNPKLSLHLSHLLELCTTHPHHPREVVWEPRSKGLTKSHMDKYRGERHRTRRPLVKEERQGWMQARTMIPMVLLGLQQQEVRSGRWVDLKVDHLLRYLLPRVLLKPSCSKS